jgi:ribonuclease T1
MFRARRPLLALVTLVLLLAGGYTASAISSGDGPDTGPRPTATATGDRATAYAVLMETRPLSSLPPEVAHTVALVRAGGPFPFSRDGVVFHNREHLLPPERDGYYHEYTVPTPGESGRGAMRLVVGEGGEFYYTADHYRSFVLVDTDR